MSKDADRDKRLADALRANLRKRKESARTPADDHPANPVSPAAR